MANEANRPVWNAVSYAYRIGELRPEPCEVCGSTEVDAHHDDYARALDVRWLCRTHHSQQHGLRGRHRTEVCSKGHAFSPENTYVFWRLKKDGTRRDMRQCRICMRERKR